MSTTKPIKDRTSIENMKNYYLGSGEYRNHALIVMGLNTALRISDLLGIRWKDVYDYPKQRFKKHVCLIEKKTRKESVVALNAPVKAALSNVLDEYRRTGRLPGEDAYLFEGRKHTDMPISRSQAYRIIKEAAVACGMDEHISCHSLRKTFGYFAWKEGVSPVMLMNIYNHSSFQVTKRYLSIEQDERDEVFMKIEL